MTFRELLQPLDRFDATAEWPRVLIFYDWSLRFDRSHHYDPVEHLNAKGRHAFANQVAEWVTQILPT